MDKNEFNNKIRELGLTRNKFAVIANISYGTIANWGCTKKDGSMYNIPSWVEPMLTYYAEAIKYREMKSLIKG